MVSGTFKLKLVGIYEPVYHLSLSSSLSFSLPSSPRPTYKPQIGKAALHKHPIGQDLNLFNVLFFLRKRQLILGLITLRITLNVKL